MNEVISDFRDKFTKRIFKKGDTYSHKNGERVVELVDKGFLKENPESEEPKDEEE